MGRTRRKAFAQLSVRRKYSPESFSLHFHLSPDGSRILTLGKGGLMARVWDAATGKPLTPPLQHGGIVWRAAFSPDSRHLVTGCNNVQGPTVHVWDATTGQSVFTVRHGAS